MAINLGKQVIPLWIDSHTLPLSLHRLQYINFYENSYEDAFEELVEFLNWEPVPPPTDDDSDNDNHGDGSGLSEKVIAYDFQQGNPTSASHTQDNNHYKNNGRDLSRYDSNSADRSTIHYLLEFLLIPVQFILSLYLELASRIEKQSNPAPALLEKLADRLDISFNISDIQTNGDMFKDTETRRRNQSQSIKRDQSIRIPPETIDNDQFLYLSPDIRDKDKSVARDITLQPVADDPLDMSPDYSKLFNPESTDREIRSLVYHLTNFEDNPANKYEINVDDNVMQSAEEIVKRKFEDNTDSDHDDMTHTDNYLNQNLDSL
jgi:hypothetical protein